MPPTQTARNNRAIDDVDLVDAEAIEQLRERVGPQGGCLCGGDIRPEV
ncbi:MAG: hypothetical protein ACOYD1_03080 [Candidatus Nanopelagicales bacterium]